MKRIIIFLCAMIVSFNAVFAQSQTSDYYYRKAYEMMKNDGNPEEIMNLLKKQIQENPRHMDSYLMLSSYLNGQQDFSSSLKYLNQALDMNYKNSGTPDEIIYWFKGNVYDLMGQYEKGIDMFKKSLKKADKKCPGNKLNMMDDLASCYADAEMYDESDAVYHEIIRQDESLQSPYIGIALNQLYRGHYHEALEVADRCAALDEDYPEIYKVRYLAYKGQNENRKAIDNMLLLFEQSMDYENLDVELFMSESDYSIAKIQENILNTRDNMVWKVILANIYENDYRFESLFTLYQDMLNDYGNDTSILFQRGKAFNLVGMFQEAISDFEGYFMSGRADETDYAERGYSYENLGEYEKAIDDYQKMIDYQPTYAYGYYRVGLCYEMLGQNDRAMEYYDRGIAIDPTYPYIFLMRGEMNLKQGRQEKAEEDFQKILQLDTIAYNGSCRQYALLLLGKEEDAFAWMEKIIENNPKDAGIYYDKACMLARAGRVDDAIDALETAFVKGFRRIGLVKDDDDLDLLRENPRFQKLTEKYSSILDDEKEALRIKLHVKGKEDYVISEVDLRKTYGGTYEIQCAVNGLPLKMVLDTGASDVSISSVEANFMLKNGYLSEEDIKGKIHYQIANGAIEEGAMICLKEVKIGDAVLKNIEASVSYNQNSPLLLGQSVLEKFGTVTVDNVNSKLIIKQ